jgi:hypothetical protein
MAWFSSKNKIQVHVDYICESCEQPNGFDQTIDITGMGGFGDASSPDLEKQISQKYDSTNVKPQPCINCGYKQSWMINSAKARFATIFVGASFLVSIILLGNIGEGWSVCYGGLPASLLIGWAVYNLYDPNRNRKAADRIYKPHISIK